MKETSPAETRPSLLHGFLSLLLPGLGQLVAGAITRAIAIFSAIAVMGGISIWTIAQKARFPDYGLSLQIFVRLVLESAILLVVLSLIVRMVVRYSVKDHAIAALKNIFLGILYFAIVVLVKDRFLAMAGTVEAIKLIHATTAVLSAAALVALWFWQVVDASKVGTLVKGKKSPSMGGLILILCLMIFVLGYNITSIEPGKAISEYKDIVIILPRIAWPWENAFDYDQEIVEVGQRIQAPCPEGATGPEANSPSDSEAWVSASPTCGQLSERDLSGGFTLGSELTITGGNFTPGQEVQILWKNPIGNPFVPRGVGETAITIEDDGTFNALMYIPSAVVPEGTSVGDQLHTLVIRESSKEVFSTRLSDEMKLALAGMLETIMMALMATFFGIILAFPLAFLAARNIMGPIRSPLNRVVGGIIGLALGAMAAMWVIQQASVALGGLNESPVQIFTIAVFSLLLLSMLGLQIGGRLFAMILTSQSTVFGKLLTAILLAVVAAGPGYALGLGFSRGIRSIVISEEVAAINEIGFAYAGAVILALLAFVYAFFSKQQEDMPVGYTIYSVTRTIMNIVRSIEPIIWAIVAAIWVGLGPFAGTIALTLHTIAALGKLYSEAIESIDPGPLEALRATGSNNLQTIVYAVVPQVLPPFISFTIYRWDINVRLSTIIGFVGGGGIGFILLQWQRLSQWDNVGLAVWLIAITVSVLDFVSSSIRERFI